MAVRQTLSVTTLLLAVLAAGCSSSSSRSSISSNTGASAVTTITVATSGESNVPSVPPTSAVQPVLGIGSCPLIDPAVVYEQFTDLQLVNVSSFDQNGAICAFSTAGVRSRDEWGGKTPLVFIKLAHDDGKENTLAGLSEGEQWSPPVVYNTVEIYEVCAPKTYGSYRAYAIGQHEVHLRVELFIPPVLTCSSAIDERVVQFTEFALDHLVDEARKAL